MRLGNNWRAASEPRFLKAEEFAVLQDAKIYQEYGLQSLSTCTYTNGQARLVVEAFEMSYPSGAHGLFTFNRRVSSQPSRQEFHIGRYLVSISGDQDQALAAKTENDADFLSAIERHLFEGPFELSPLPSHLPERDKIPASEVYLLGIEALSRQEAFRDLKDIISFAGGAEAAAASYRNGDGVMNLLIVEFYTPQLASTAYSRVKDHLQTLPPSHQEQRIIKRTGNYIIEAVGIRDQKAAQELIDQIKYTARVYWEGDKLTSIPLPFRPPDKFVLEEAARTAQLLVTTFYAVGLTVIGAVLLGVLTGGYIFYWRRYQRRKMGLGNAFSDGGGTIRLNLDGIDLLLSDGKSQIKFLSKSE